MSRDSLANTKTELGALLAPGGTPAIAGTTAVYDHEPYRGQGLKPVWVTLSTAGMTPDSYLVAVRIYHGTDTAAADTAQDSLDALIQAYDTLIGSTGRFGPSNWAVEWEEELDAYVATSILAVGREDRAFS